MQSSFNLQIWGQGRAQGHIWVPILNWCGEEHEEIIEGREYGQERNISKQLCGRKWPCRGNVRPTSVRNYWFAALCGARVQSESNNYFVNILSYLCTGGNHSRRILQGVWAGFTCFLYSCRRQHYLLLDRIRSLIGMTKKLLWLNIWRWSARRKISFWIRS